jgi:hypothetical protein
VAQWAGHGGNDAAAAAAVQPNSTAVSSLG